MEPTASGSPSLVAVATRQGNVGLCIPRTPGFEVRRGGACCGAGGGFIGARAGASPTNPVR